YSPALPDVATSPAAAQSNSQELGVALSEFGQLGRNDHLTVALAGIERIVIVMIAFSRPEFLGRKQAGHHRHTDFLLYLLDKLLSGFLLLRRLVENGRCVLRADIAALPVKRAWIVRGKEHLQYGFEIDDIRIKHQ